MGVRMCGRSENGEEGIIVEQFLNFVFNLSEFPTYINTSQSHKNLKVSYKLGQHLKGIFPIIFDLMGF